MTAIELHQARLAGNAPDAHSLRTMRAAGKLPKGQEWGAYREVGGTHLEFIPVVAAVKDLPASQLCNEQEVPYNFVGFVDLDEGTITPHAL